MPIAITKVVVFCFITILLHLSCNENEQLIINNPLVNDPVDTLLLQISDGVYTELINLQNSYLLDDELKFQIIVYNLSDTSGFRINYGYLQAYNWKVYNGQNNYIAGGPTVVSPAGFYRNLEIGDSVIFNLKWDQCIYSETKIISDLKTFSGNYYLQARPLGNDLFKQMTKFFEISDAGDLLSVNVDKDYEIEDTLKFQFVIRNRTSENLSYNLPSQKPIEVRFIQYEDTTLIQYFTLPYIQLQLEPRSDNYLFEYKTAIDDTSLSILSGIYTVVTSIFIESREYSSYCFEFF